MEPAAEIEIESGGQARLVAIIIIKIAGLLLALWYQVPQTEFVYAAF